MRRNVAAREPFRKKKICTPKFYPKADGGMICQSILLFTYAFFILGISFCLMEPRIVWTIWRPSCLHLPSTKITGICPHSWLFASWFYVRNLHDHPKRKRYLSVKLSRVSPRGSPAFRGLPPNQTSWKLAESRAKVTNWWRAFLLDQYLLKYHSKFRKAGV